MHAATLGCLEFSLLYEPENHALHCCIVKAKVRTHIRKTATPETKLNRARQISWYTCRTAVKMLHDQTGSEDKSHDERRKKKDREQHEMRQCTNGRDKEKAETRGDEMRQD